ncbi:MAG: hypothetical protein JNM30_20015 [Rhodospirillales bacterium]|nr:hypothetical protein [Rhodospirillales bacterium]
MDERQKKAFDLATEIAKQIITLSSGILALSITFYEKIATKIGSLNLLYCSWGAFLLAIILCIFTLGALAGQLDPSRGSASPTIYGSTVRWLSILQNLAFVAGVVMMIIYAVSSRPQ